VLNFISAYYDDENNLVIDRCQIAKNYLKGWFIIDTIAIFPLYLILDESNKFNSLARIAKLPRLSKMLRFAK
jgi:hypothetical protein